MVLVARCTWNSWFAIKSKQKADGDTESETLFTHAYDHRRWRITQNIEKLGFN